MDEIERLAREGFYGSDPELDARVRAFLGAPEGEGWGVDLEEYVRAVQALAAQGQVPPRDGLGPGAGERAGTEEGARSVAHAEQYGPYRLTPAALGGGFLEGPDPADPGRTARVALDEGLWDAAMTWAEDLKELPAAAGLVLAHLVWGERAGLGPLEALEGAAPPEGARYFALRQWPYEVRVAVRVEALGVWALAHPALGPDGQPVLRVFAPLLAADVEGLLRRVGPGPGGVRELRTAEERALAHRLGELPPPPNPYEAAAARLVGEALRKEEGEMTGERGRRYCGEERGALELLDEAPAWARGTIATRKAAGGEG